MTYCSECKEEVESDATSCPHCGYSPREDITQATVMALVLGILFVILFLPVGLGLLLLASVGIVKLKMNDYTFGDS
jgi:hypothetical protein